MRALKMLGLAEDGVHLVYEEPESGDRFAIPTDERLRIAVNARPRVQNTGSGRLGLGQSGRLSGHLGQPAKKEIPMEPKLRPREIQSRIRGGASLEQVAAEAGCDTSRIERFAFPILVERGSIAERAKQARPVVEGAPSRKSVEQLVRETLQERGQADSIQWDAYRTDAGSWVLKLTWNAGRSENSARWTFFPSSGGGSLSPLDGGATEIIDPAPRPLRTVREELEAAPEVPINPLATQTIPEPSPAATPVVGSVAETPSTPPLFDAPARVVGPNKVAAALAHHAVSSPHASQTTTDEHDERTQRADHPVARTGTEDAGGRRGQRAPMPSWEDVLLGVRSSGR